MKQKPKSQNIVEVLLKNRGIKTKKEKGEFFSPPNPCDISTKDFGIDPKQVKKAVGRIKKAIKNKEKIIVYGDYDVDGICATAIIWEALYNLGANALPYIPSRFTEGYGLNVESIKKLKEDSTELKLIITVDHGIVAHEKVKFAKDLGLDVIIMDHHEPGETRPDALAVVHTTKISGSAVAWVLVTELLRVLPQGPFDHLGLAALGTVSDVLPLVNLNRSIVVHGLNVLRSTQRVGIRALCKEAVVDQKSLDTYHIGFILGPRLNAMGRVEHAMDSLRLLCTKNAEKARELALKLGRTNRLRQDKTDAAVDHVHTQNGASWANGNLPKLLFVHHESYDEGVIGIAAGRLVDKYYRPAIVVSRGQEFSKASARSVNGVNIIEMIREAGQDILVNAGGHPMAAGFTIRTCDIEVLGQKLTEASQGISDKLLTRETRIDCEIDFSEISMQLHEALSKFAPFGYGNPEPVFLTKGVFVQNSRLVGKDGGHLKLSLAQDSGVSFGAVGFRMGELYPKLKLDAPVDIAYCVELDEWNGRKRLQLKLKKIFL